MDIFNPENEVKVNGTILKPSEGQKIQGTFVGTHITQLESKYGDHGMQDVMYVDLIGVSIDGVAQKPSEQYTIKANYRLEQAIKTLSPQPGWVIGIIYLGKTWKNKQGTMSDDWKVYGNEKAVDPQFREKMAASAAENEAQPLSAAFPLGQQAPAAAAAALPDPFTTPTEWHNKICALLAGKKGINEVEAAKAKAMELTGIPYLPDKLGDVYARLVQILGA